ncbi:MAG: hypothetical protein IPG23_05675 [Burkholderiales bacterium]|nr:hypothetical protein [Burkholderiales bacterium]
MDPFEPDRAADPLLMVWGDSMAAQLYPGLRAVQQQHGGLRLGQFTIASCPPVLGFRPVALCAEVNESTFARIVQARPRWVLLSARSWSAKDFAELKATVTRLQEQASAQVWLVGEPPQWSDRLPLVALKWLNEHPNQGLPTHLSSGLNPLTWQKDRELRDIAGRLGVGYVSLVDLLCRGGACRVRLDTGHEQLVAWDAFHLTNEGSLLVARELDKRIVQ